MKIPDTHRSRFRSHYRSRLFRISKITSHFLCIKLMIYLPSVVAVTVNVCAITTESKTILIPMMINRLSNARRFTPNSIGTGGFAMSDLCPSRSLWLDNNF